MQPSHLAQFDDTPIYNTRAAVRLTQVEAPRLRAWERRYAILAPHRSTNSYRLYSERDLAIIRWLRDQVAAGMTISQATAYLRDHSEPLPTDGQLPAETPLAAPQLDHLTQTLVAAALRLDEAAATQALAHALALFSVEDVCQGMISPALTALGEMWSENHELIVPEHFLSQVIRAQLDALWHTTYPPHDGPLILVACAPGEQHELGACMLALLLRRHGMRVTFLGENNEAVSLTVTAKQLRPAVICLSATLPEHKLPALDLARRLSEATTARIFIGGQAVAQQNGARIPDRVTVLHATGSEAVALIQRATQDRSLLAG